MSGWCTRGPSPQPVRTARAGGQGAGRRPGAAASQDGAGSSCPGNENQPPGNEGSSSGPSDSPTRSTGNAKTRKRRLVGRHRGKSWAGGPGYPPLAPITRAGPLRSPGPRRPMLPGDRSRAPPPSSLSPAGAGNRGSGLCHGGSLSPALPSTAPAPTLLCFPFSFFLLKRELLKRGQSRIKPAPLCTPDGGPCHWLLHRSEHVNTRKWLQRGVPGWLRRFHCPWFVGFCEKASGWGVEGLPVLVVPPLPDSPQASVPGMWVIISPIKQT